MLSFEYTTTNSIVSVIIQVNLGLDLQNILGQT